MDISINYEIIEEIAVISEKKTQTGKITKEVNLISFSGKEPKYDIRVWKYDGEEKRMLKGISLNKEECEKLKEVMRDLK